MYLKEDANSDAEEAESMIPGRGNRLVIIIKEPGTKSVLDKSQHLTRYLVTALISISFLSLVTLRVPKMTAVEHQQMKLTILAVAVELLQTPVKDVYCLKLRPF